MHEDLHLHGRAAEQHELAARAHRTAAEHNEKGDDEGGKWHAERALEYSDRAYKLAKEAHTKSGQIGPFNLCLLVITMDRITKTTSEPPNYMTLPRMPIVLPSSLDNRAT
ncbi:MAG: hypothetical protein ABSB35_39480 [Bryobacteraceae bacterium]